MRKQLGKLLALALALLMLAGCQSPGEQRAMVKPYPLDEGQREVLSLLGVENDAMMFSYRVPEETRSLMATTYVLEDGAWVVHDYAGTAWDGTEQGNTGEGTFTLLRQTDGSFILRVDALGTFTCITRSVEVPAVNSRTHTWLSKEVEAVPEEEIPVALFVFAEGNTALPSCKVEDYFTPEKFEVKGTVQAVTLRFSPNEL